MQERIKGEPHWQGAGLKKLGSTLWCNPILWGDFFLGHLTFLSECIYGISQHDNHFKSFLDTLMVWHVIIVLIWQVTTNLECLVLLPSPLWMKICNICFLTNSPWYYIRMRIEWPLVNGFSLSYMTAWQYLYDLDTNKLLCISNTHRPIIMSQYHVHISYG